MADTCAHCGAPAAEERVWRRLPFAHAWEARVGGALLIRLTRLEKSWEWRVKGRAPNRSEASGVSATCREARVAAQEAALKVLNAALHSLDRVVAEDAIGMLCGKPTGRGPCFSEPGHEGACRPAGA